MSAIDGTACPLLGAECNTECMMMLMVEKNGEMSCAFTTLALAVLALPIMSEDHGGGNYLMKKLPFCAGEGEGE